MPEHDVQQANAEQAYTQAEIEGTPTWVRLPHDVSESKLPDTGVKVRVIEYNMEDFLRSWVESTRSLRA